MGFGGHVLQVELQSVTEKNKKKTFHHSKLRNGEF